MNFHFRKLRFYVLSVLFLALAFGVAHAQDIPSFPVTIEHKFGSTTITHAPQRVVAIGYTEQDLLLAVGVTPIAVRYWYGDETNAIFPWAQDKVEGDNPIVLNMPYGNLNYEAILALQPDLISAVTSGITQEEYDLLSQIAPTIAQTADYIDFGMPWQEATQMVGDAVGKHAEAEAAIANVDAQFAAARAQHPEFEGKTVAVAYDSEGTYGFYTSQDTRGRFFTDLGFVVPDELVSIAGDSFYANVSAERIDLLDQDLIALVNLQFIKGGRETLKADPLWQSLDAVKEDRVVYFDEQDENALGFSSPLSLPYALNAALPQLEAIFGSPASETAACEAGFRSFDHELLATDAVCIPENPQRIAAVDTFTLETLLSLGIKPVSGPFLETFLRDHPQYTDQLAGVIDTSYPVNAEALVQAQPDLIISIEPWIKETFKEISQIAPTVSIQYPGDGNWQEIVHTIRDAINQSEALNHVFDAYHARLQTFQETIADSSVGDVAIVFLLPDQLAPFLSDTFSGAILLETGLNFPQALVEAASDGTLTDISQERLDLIASSDHIFVVTSGFTDEDLAAYQELIANLEANPLWQSLPAVQAGNVYIVGRDWLGSSLIAANVVVDDLFTNIAAVDPATISPNPFIPVVLHPEATAAP